jgi:hypothetical protein
MPFTPFHMGAGLAAKAAIDRHFSVLTFGVAQVAMDIEPLIGMIRNSDVLHGPTHTYIGALVIGFVVMLVSPFICRPILRRYNYEAHAIGAGLGGLTNVLTNKYRPEFTVKKPFRSALLALTIAALINMIIGLIQAPASAVINHDPLVPPFSLTLFIVSFIVYLNRTPDTITNVSTSSVFNASALVKLIFVLAARLRLRSKVLSSCPLFFRSRYR